MDMLLILGHVKVSSWRRLKTSGEEDLVKRDIEDNPVVNSVVFFAVSGEE